MGRSGTSFVTNWLQKCGLNLGNILLEANYNNINGFFENKEIVELHNSILKKSAVEVTLEDRITITERHLELAEKIVSKNNDIFYQWGWKDPRTALFINSLWHPIVPNAKVLVVFRNYKYVVESIFKTERRTQMNRRNKVKGFFYFVLDKLHYNHFKRSNTYLEAWIRYNSDILEFLKKKKEDDYYVLNVEKLLWNSNTVFSNLTNNFRLSLSYYNPNSLYDSDLFTISTKSRIAFDPVLEERAIKILDELSKLCFKDIDYTQIS